jgi:predicted ATP-grasp superfamily ATP-dependent carboligase
LKTLVRTKKYELIIPCSDYSTLLISEFRDELLPYARIPLPGRELVETVTSKSALMRFAEANAISIPRTFYPAEQKDLENAASHMKYPVVLKGDVTAGAIKVRYVRSASALVKTYNELRRIDEAPILQEYIDGRELLFYGLCNQGRLIASFMMESIRAYPPTGGTPAKAVSVYEAGLKDFASDIVEKAHWTGMAGFDIKQDRHTGKYHLLDFNPRFGATTALAIRCGVDFPYLLYQLAVEGKETPVHHYEKRIYRSVFKEDLFYLAKKPSFFPKWILEFLDLRVFYGYDRDDPAPYYRLAANALLELKNIILR